MKFVNLHNHTSYSPDGLCTPESLCSIAQSLNQPAIALTDHNTLSGIMELYQQAKRFKVKPIFGNEMYFDWYQNPESTKLFHITILAQNKIGYQNLLRLNNYSHTQIVEKRNGNFPTSTIESLYNYREGLIVLTGCSSAVLHDVEDETEALEYVHNLKNIFEENLYIELMLQYKAEENLYRCNLAHKKFGIPLVITNDAHYNYAWQEEVHELSVLAKKGYNYTSTGLYIQSVEEVVNNASKYLDFETVQQIINQTVEVAEKIETFDIIEKAKLPEIPKDGKEELYNFLLSKVEPQYIEQMKFEWKVIEDMDFISYFYIIYDLKKFAEEKGIFTRCRGSGAGSYLIYLMNITPVHPIKYGLYFDRFINYSRYDPPDLDLDVDPQRRHEIFEYMLKRWGMIPVSTFLEYSHKSAIHDICRVLRKEKSIEIPYKIEEAAADSENELSDAFLELCKISELIKPFYNSIIGTNKTRGKHAAAVANAVNLAPIENWNNESSLAWSESGSGDKFLQDAGIVKMDILSVDALAINSICEKLTGVKFQVEMADWEVYDLFSNEIKSLSGIFQFKSGASIKLARQIKPSSLDDISAIVALNRPGPLDSGMAWSYAGYKANPRTLHPQLDDVLTSTYGVIIYQEQVMELYSRITGDGAEGRNDARKYLVPKSFKLLDDPKFVESKNKLKKKFMELGEKNNFSIELLAKVWHECDTFGRYGFNKAHSIVYAFNALESAFYKVKYPEIFFLAAMQVEDTNADGRKKIQEFAFEAAQHGVKLATPHILYSGVNFELREKVLYFPLTTIKGMGEERVKSLITYREKNKIETFSDINRIPKDVLNKTCKKHLFILGGFSGIVEDEKIVGLDYKEIAELSSKSSGDIQMATMGFILPNDKLLKMIQTLRLSTERVGYVIDIKAGFTKTNKPKRIITLYPKGYFSIMDMEFELNVGDLIYVNLNDFNMPERFMFIEKKRKYNNKFGKMVEANEKL